MIPPFGQIRLSEVTPETIQAAVLELRNNDRAREKTEEIALLELATWDSVSRNCAEWIAEALRTGTKGRIAA
jgi:hypothetical protein